MFTRYDIVAKQFAIALSVFTFNDRLRSENAQVAKFLFVLNNLLR